MTAKKIILALAIVGVVGIASISGFMYLVLRTKDKDVSAYPPYNTLINKELILKRDAIIVNNLEAFSFETKFLLEEPDANLYEGTSVHYILKKGDTLLVKKAKHFYNSVSGFTTSVVFAEVRLPDIHKKIKIEYHWGDQEITLDKSDKVSFTFKKALWQTKELSDVFVF